MAILCWKKFSFFFFFSIYYQYSKAGEAQRTDGPPAFEFQKFLRYVAAKRVIASWKRTLGTVDALCLVIFLPYLCVFEKKGTNNFFSSR